MSKQYTVSGSKGFWLTIMMLVDRGLPQYLKDIAPKKDQHAVETVERINKAVRKSIAEADKPLSFLEECYLELAKRETRFDIPDDPSEASEMSMMSHIKAMKEADEGTKKGTSQDENSENPHHS